MKAVIYTASNVMEYDIMLGMIVKTALNANLSTDLKNRKVYVTYEDDYLGEMKEVYDALDKNAVTIEEASFRKFAITDREEKLLDELTDTKEALDKVIAENEHLKIEIGRAGEERDRYKEMYHNASARNYQTAQRGRAIAVLLSAMFPEK